MPNKEMLNFFFQLSYVTPFSSTNTLEKQERIDIGRQLVIFSGSPFLKSGVT